MRAPLLLFVFSLALTARADVAVLTQHNDNNRDGMNLNETILNTANVNTNSFGLLYTRPVDDQIYAQPLIMTNVAIPGQGSHNLLILCTVNDSIYAYDADDPTVTNAYWTRSFISPPKIVAPVNTDMTGACSGNYKDFSGGFGIVGTPVIDPATGTMYVVVRTKESSGSITNYAQSLHALDVTTGLDTANSPVLINATFPGNNSVDSVGGIINFDPYKHNQRPGLVLANGMVYITWAGHCDWTPYHGWVIGYNTSNLLQAPLVFNSSPNGDQAGIWMSNQGPVADADGNIYFSTGNGSVDAVDLGEAFVKLTPDGPNLDVASFFVPTNYNSLNGGDLDISCGGLLLIPNTSLILSGGKAGTLYLLNKDNMGGLGAVTNNDLQEWSLGGHSIHGGPVWWTGPTNSFAYIWGASSDHLRQYQFNTNTQTFNTNTVAQSVTKGGSGQPGGILAVTANGSNANTGVVWASLNTTANANQAVVAGSLHAYDAQNVSRELWNSDLLSSRDAIGNFAKFVAPTVANGKVYMATFSNRLNVYGLLPHPALSVAISGTSVVLSWPANGFPGFTLQTNANLGAGAWSGDNHSVVTVNGTNQVTIPAAGAATYYRLIR